MSFSNKPVECALHMLECAGEAIRTSVDDGREQPDTNEQAVVNLLRLMCQILRHHKLDPVVLLGALELCKLDIAHEYHEGRTREEMERGR